MLIIVSKDISPEAKCILEKYGTLLIFSTKGIVYEAIENHPDIFLFPNNGQIIAAPNTPLAIIDTLKKQNVPIETGEKPIRSIYPNTCMYNVVISDKYLIHNITYTDIAIKNKYKHLIPIHVNQGYTRCNLLALPNNSFITSDHGIAGVLQVKGIDVLYVKPADIILKNFSHGFFGGCCGIGAGCFFVNGSLSYFSERNKIEYFIERAGLKQIELSGGKPEDIGSMFFV